MTLPEAAFCALLFCLLAPFTLLPVVAGVWLAMSLNRRDSTRFRLLHGERCGCKTCVLHENMRRATRE